MGGAAIQRGKLAVVPSAENLGREARKADCFWFALAPAKALHCDFVAEEQRSGYNMLAGYFT
jgi:hypothetical protein